MSGRRTKALRAEYRKLPVQMRRYSMRIDAQGTLRGNHFREFKNGRQAEAAEHAAFLQRREAREFERRANNQRILDGVRKSQEARGIAA